MNDPFGVYEVSKGLPSALRRGNKAKGVYARLRQGAHDYGQSNRKNAGTVKSKDYLKYYGGIDRNNARKLVAKAVKLPAPAAKLARKAVRANIKRKKGGSWVPGMDRANLESGRLERVKLL